MQTELKKPHPDGLIHACKKYVEIWIGLTLKLWISILGGCIKKSNKEFRYLVCTFFNVILDYERKRSALCVFH